MSRSKVYHFLLDHRVGGPHIYAKTLTSALTEKYDFEYITTAKGEMTDQALVNLRHKHNALYPIEILSNVGLTITKAYVGDLSKKAVIFHVHGAANIAPVIAAGILKVPCLWTMHEIVPTFKPLVKVARYFLKRTPHKFTAVTEKSATVFDLENATLLPSPVDSEFWNPEYKKEQIKRDVPGRLELLSVANLNPLKGQDILLEALKGLKGSWRMLFIGQVLSTHANYFEHLKNLSNEILSQNPEAHIEFLGWKNNEEVRELHQQTDAFIMPSRSEACPIALLEAMVMGKVCIASDVGGIRSMISTRDLGFLIPSESPDELLKALLAVQSMTNSARSALGKASREQIKTHYSLPKLAKRLGDLYQELLQK